MSTAVELKEEFEIEKATETDMLRAAPVPASPVGVDRENKIIRGRVVAQLGAFKTGRGEFTEDSLRAIVKLYKQHPEGVPANYGHHSDTGAAETLDAFIGVDKNARIDGDKVRADLHLNPVAFLPDGTGSSRGERLMLRAESAPTSFGSSLVLGADKLYRLDNRSRRKTDENGNVLPPVWMPNMLRSSDVVAVGDAVHGGFLSAEDQLNAKIEELFADSTREEIETALSAIRKYLDGRFPVEQLEATPEPPVEQPAAEAKTEPEAEPCCDDETLRLRWKNKVRKAGVN